MDNTLKIKSEKETTSSSGLPIALSKYTQALIKSFQAGTPRVSTSPNKISVSQTVSFAAFLYEKMRNAVEFREEHLIRRAAIERILKRRIILSENGREVAEPLIKELMWARYYENNTIPEEQVSEIQKGIDKYIYIRNEISAGRSSREKEKIYSFILDVLSTEIEEKLSPNPRLEAFTNFTYQLLRTKIAPFDITNTQERDIQVYITVERTFAQNDEAIIRYHLLKLYLPEIPNLSWKTSEKILSQFHDIYLQIEKHLKHLLSDKLRNIIRKQIPPFLILRDIFDQNPASIKVILSDETLLKHKVDEVCRRKYEQTKDRLRRTGIRSFIYILLTKAIFAFLIEIPYDLYVIRSLDYIPIAINVAFPPLLMSVIILSVTVPGDDNTKRIYGLIKEIISEDPDLDKDKGGVLEISKPTKTRGVLFTTLFTSLYLLTYFVSFGTIIYILSKLNFNIVSQAVFIFFVTLVAFFGFKVIQITREYLVVDKEGPLSPIVDFFFLPILRVGQWLSGELLEKFNVLIFIFDFIIEMPFKAIVEVIEEWIHFIRLKKEEIV